MKKMILAIAIACVSMMSFWLYGCGDAGGAAKTDPPVQMVVSFENSFLESDVCTETGSTCVFFDDVAQINVRVFAIDPEIEDTSYYMDVILTGYEIKFDRMDTGTAVPKTFVANCSNYCELDTSTEVDVIVCRASQKDMPPLSYLWQLGYDPETGLDTIHTTATITVWGKTLAGKEVVSNPARITVYFANYVQE